MHICTQHSGRSNNAGGWCGVVSQETARSGLSVFFFFFCFCCWFSIDSAFSLSFFFSFRVSIPAQRVLGHYWRTDHLGTVAAEAVGRQTTRRSTSAALALLLSSRVRTLVQLTALAVPTSHPEHTSTIGSSTSNNSNTDTNGASPRLRRATGAGVRVVVIAVAAVVTAIVTVGTTTAAARRATATHRRARLTNQQGNRRVDHRHQGLRCRVGLLEQCRVGVVDLRLQIIHHVRRNVGHGHCRDVARHHRIVVRLDSEHGHLVTGHSQRIGHSLRNVQEDLGR